MDKLLQKGYAEEVPNKQISTNYNVWYIPHQPVVTEKKPGKLRIVFDCAAKYRGESQTDKAFQGPDLNNKLTYVMLRFRQDYYAIMADIEAMYNQLKVPEHDRDPLRFIWYDKNRTVRHFRMKFHLFGGMWCASAATYAVRRISRYQVVSTLVKDTLLSAFYVDDCLKSVGSREEAEQVTGELRDALSEAGFHLTKFFSNDDELLFDLAVEDIANEVRLMDKDNDSKALGIKWNTEADYFCFEVERKDTTRLTRRKMVSCVSFMYDPLGLVEPIILRGKMLFQEATKRCFAWDAEIPKDLANEWKIWSEEVMDVRDIRIPHCIKPSQYDDAFTELHHFSDASEKAYGSCSYLRCVNKDGQINTALLLSKIRVAPMKTLTIPRLELQAAILAVRVDVMLKEELDLHLCESTFWVDSEIVLGYIKNEAKRFHVFVANRVSVIRRNTHPVQWRHIAGCDNSADIISRGCTPGKIEGNEWLIGLNFMRKHIAMDTKRGRPTCE